MKTVALKELTRITSGFAFKSQLFSETGDIPLIRIRDVKRGFSYTYYSGEYSPVYIINKDDLLIGMDGEFNAEKWRGDKALLNQRVCKIEADGKNLHQDYLYYYLPRILKKIEEATPSVTVKHLSVNNINEIEIPLPPLEEQKRIAVILDKADAIRRKRQAAIKLADDFLRAIFLDMFGDPVTNPKGWEVRQIGELLSFLTSGSRGWAKYYSKDGALFLRIQNIGNNELILDDVAFVTTSESAEARRTKVLAGDVLLSITADLGRTAVIPDNLPSAHINQHLAILRFNEVESLYASAFLASSGGRCQINKLNRGGVKAGLNFDDIKSLEMMLPPVTFQKRWVQIYKKNIQRNHKHNTAKVLDDYLFNSLTQRAFRGEL